MCVECRFLPVTKTKWINMGGLFQFHGRLYFEHVAKQKFIARQFISLENDSCRLKIMRNVTEFIQRECREFVFLSY